MLKKFDEITTGSSGLNYRICNVVRAGAVAWLLSFISLPAGAATDLTNAVFVPVSPCKVGDTRPNGFINANEFVDWVAYGVGEIATQGGNQAGCPNPKPAKTPIGIAVTVNAIGKSATGDGNLQAYPADGSPGGVTVVYSQGQNTASASLLGLSSNGRFRLESRQANLQASAIVTGYFYASPAREVTVGREGGDYDSIAAALLDSDTWCPSPDALNPCTVNVASGGYFAAQVEMKSYISIKGAGQLSTTVGYFFGGPIFIFDGVVWSSISDLTISQPQSVVSSVAKGVLVDTSNGAANGILLENLSIQISGATNSNTAVEIKDSGALGDAGLVRIESSFLAASGTAATGIYVGGDVNLALDRVQVSSTGTALDIENGVSLGGPVDDAQFTGSTWDIFANGVTATLLNTHLGTGTKSFTSSTITCLNVTTPTEMLTSSCGSPP